MHQSRFASGGCVPLLFAGVAVAALAGAADFGWHYWTVGRFEVSTDDAYVKADSTTIAPKVSGYIATVLVGDNETVKAGQILARIDDRDFKVSLEQAKAEVEAAEANIANKQAALAAQQSAIDAAKATVEADKADETFAEQDDQRYAELAKKRVRHRSERTAGRLAHRRRPCRGYARHRGARQCDQAARRDQGRARPGTGGARQRQGGTGSGRAEPLLHRPSSRPSTA